MISHKNLIKIAKKWQNFTSLRRKRISSSSQPTASNMDEAPCGTTPRAEKGHFIVYTFDNRRFMIPLAYLKNDIFTKLLEDAEEEFGPPRDRPITLPCDSIFMEHFLSTIQRSVGKDLHKAKTLHMNSGHSLRPSLVLKEHRHNPGPIFSF